MRDAPSPPDAAAFRTNFGFSVLSVPKAAMVPEYTLSPPATARTKNTRPSCVHAAFVLEDSPVSSGSFRPLETSTAQS